MVGLPQLDQRDAMLPLKTGGTAAAAFLLGAWLYGGYRLTLEYRYLGFAGFSVFHWLVVSAVLALRAGAGAALATPFHRQPYGWKSLVSANGSCLFCVGSVGINCGL
jgi:hypothetical protein